MLPITSHAEMNEIAKLNFKIPFPGPASSELLKLIYCCLGECLCPIQGAVAIQMTQRFGNLPRGTHSEIAILTSLALGPQQKVAELALSLLHHFSKSLTFKQKSTHTQLKMLASFKIFLIAAIALVNAAPAPQAQVTTITYEQPVIPSGVLPAAAANPPSVYLVPGSSGAASTTLVAFVTATVTIDQLSTTATVTATLSLHLSCKSKNSFVHCRKLQLLPVTKSTKTSI